jgi:uncharacterized membrane protein
MSVIEKSIEVAVPRRTVYDQWTQFEEFPTFMGGIERVQQVDDKHLHWKGQIAGVEREWDSEIIHQEPDDRITWRTTQGAQNDGTVSFASISPDRTQVTMRLEFEPEGFAEKAADVLHLVDLRVTKDLDNFKEFIEDREAETGAWRGDIKPTGEVDPGPDQRLE